MARIRRAAAEVQYRFWRHIFSWFFAFDLRVFVVMQQASYTAASRPSLVELRAYMMRAKPVPNQLHRMGRTSARYISAPERQ